jgi:uncharacterized protein YfdQ (DUF2303 family)
VRRFSDANGEFSIIAKQDDILVFVSKEHQIKRKQQLTLNYSQRRISVELILKAEELNSSYYKYAIY